MPAHAPGAHGHGPFQFGVAGADLVLVGAGIAPEAVGGRGFQDAVDHAQLTGHGVHLRLGQVGDRAQVHTAVAILGEEAHAEVLDLVPRAGDQEPQQPGEVIEHRHAQAGAGIGQAQFHAALIVLGQDIDQLVEHGCQLHRFHTHVRVPLAQPGDVVLGAGHLIEGLVDGHLHAQRGQSGTGTERAGDGAVDAAADAHDEALLPGPFTVVLQPGGDVLDDLVRLHVGCGMKKPREGPQGFRKGP